MKVGKNRGKSWYHTWSFVSSLDFYIRNKKQSSGAFSGSQYFLILLIFYCEKHWRLIEDMLLIFRLNKLIVNLIQDWLTQQVCTWTDLGTSPQTSQFLNLRISEIISFCWKQIDWILIKHNTKTHEQSMVGYLNAKKVKIQKLFSHSKQ